MSFVIRFDFARHTDVFHRGHINQETAWQSDMRSDPCSLLCNWFFGNLDQYLLAFAQQIRNCRLMPITSRLSPGALVRIPLLRTLLMIFSDRNRRGGNLLSRFGHLRSFMIIIGAIRTRLCLFNGCRLSLLPLARAATTSTSSSRRKLSPRL